MEVLNQGASSCTPSPTRGEVAIDFPDKFYSGGFDRDCQCEARAEADGVMIRLVQAGTEKRVAEIHLHHFLFSGILYDLAVSLGAREPIDATHREPLLDAARRLVTALERVPAPTR